MIVKFGLAILFALYIPVGFCGSPIPQSGLCWRLLSQAIWPGVFRRPWVSMGRPIVQNLPLSEFFENGVAHVRIPSEILKEISSANVGGNFYERWIPEESVELIKTELLRIFENEVRQIGNLKIQRAYPAMFLSHSFPLTEGWSWHRDGVVGLPPLPLENIRSGKANLFTIRATFPIAWDISPPTVVLPAGGKYIGRPLQGTSDHMTLFIRDTIFHSSPNSSVFFAKARAFVVMDLEVELQSID